MNAAIRMALAETALDLDAWHRSSPLPLRDPCWDRLAALIARDLRLEHTNQDELIDVFAKLSEWQRIHVQPGRLDGAVWHAVETHLMYHRILTPAIECCMQLEMAYLKGDGGSESIEWEDLDSAREHSVATVEALGLKGYRVDMDSGEAVFALAAAGPRAMELAAAANPDAAPESAEVVDPYTETPEPVATSGAPRP